MTMRLLFWILMLLWPIIGVGGPFYFAGGINHIYLGGGLIIYLLVGLLGWKVFGKPIDP